MKEALLETVLSSLDLKPGESYDILDFGCGSGDLLNRISSIVSADSTLVGIDAIEESITAAQALNPIVDFRHEKFVDTFTLADSSFDIVASINTMECIPDRAALLAEVARILRPNGKLLFAHWDWDTQIYNSEHIDSIRKLTASFADWEQDWMDVCDGQMGRRLWSLLEGSGRFNGSIECFVLLETQYHEGQYGFDRLHDLSNLVQTGTIDSSEYEMICTEMVTLARSQQYFYSVNCYIYVGRQAA
jgi:SAM-dependent methyltransferase